MANTNGLTRLYPMVQINKGTWEIDEFDAASIFLLEGEEKAMLIDTGMGIGDLRGAVEMITDKPLIVVHSHGHIDHTGNSRQFDEVWTHPADQWMPVPESLERRRGDTEHIARRQKGSLGAPFNLFNLYPYDIDVDLRDMDDLPMPVVHDLYDGQQFDLGGRIITVYECPGHTAGEVVFLDETRRMLFAGDALNYNLLLMGGVPLEVTLEAMKRIRDMSDRYDGIWNGHHDFRALGAPLDDDCMENAIALLEEAVKGNITYCEVPSFWGQPMPLRRRGSESADDNPFAAMGKTYLRKGRNFLQIHSMYFGKKEEK